MDTTFSIFGLTAHAYGLCAAIAAAVLIIGMKLAGKKLPEGTASVLGVLGMVLGIAGARLVYCACNVSTFTETFENAWLMLNFFDGGLSLPGLIAGLIAAAAITARVMKAGFGDVLDAASIPAGLSLAALRFGEQFTDLGIGKVVEEGFFTQNLPWLFSFSRMGVSVEYRMNVWGYEVFAGVVIFVLMLLFARCLVRSGDKAVLFAALFGTSQILLESMRDDGHMLLIFLRVGQLGAAALVMLALGLALRGASLREKWIRWMVMILCAVMIVLLEFSLDGRLTVGMPSLGRDYGVMAAVCAVMLLNDCTALFGHGKR